MSNQQTHALAERLFQAFMDNDPDTIRSCCAPDATFWKNGTRSGTVDEMLPGFANLRARVGNHRYTEVRRSAFTDGFVEEHRVVSTLPDGSPLDVVACVVGSVGPDGLITELREYVDTTPRRTPEAER
jgi:ketosteroid isomerase-like protein